MKNYSLCFRESRIMKQSDGGSTDYYKLPRSVRECQDVIEALNMTFAQGNIQKAIWRICSGGSENPVYDYKKIIWFAQREIQRIKKGK